MVEELAVINKRPESLRQNFLGSSLFKEAMVQRSQVCMLSWRLKFHNNLWQSPIWYLFRHHECCKIEGVRESSWSLALHKEGTCHFWSLNFSYSGNLGMKLRFCTMWIIVPKEAGETVGESAAWKDTEHIRTVGVRPWDLEGKKRDKRLCFNSDVFEY